MYARNFVFCSLEVRSKRESLTNTVVKQAKLKAKYEFNRDFSGGVVKNYFVNFQINSALVLLGLDSAFTIHSNSSCSCS